MRELSYDYLLHPNNTSKREYALSAAADGVITYSYTSEKFPDPETTADLNFSSGSISSSPLSADIQQENWIHSIFDFVDKITGVSFRHSEDSRGEIHLSKVADGEFDWSDGFDSGYGQWIGVHNTKQYGAMDDIRSLLMAIGSNLGLSYPGGSFSHKGYTVDDSIMSTRKGYFKSAGMSFMYTEDDQNALRHLFGSSSFQPSKSKIKHKQSIKEDLLIGTDGVKDIFRLTAKGVISEKKYLIKCCDPVFVGMSNNYNIPYIANFNQADGDKILISKRLFNQISPIDGNKKIRIKKTKGLKVKFRFAYDDKDPFMTGHNIYSNTAGKLFLDTNGKKDGLGPSKNSDMGAYYVAFVDLVGPQDVVLTQQDVGWF